MSCCFRCRHWPGVVACANRIRVLDTRDAAIVSGPASVPRGLSEPMVAAALSYKGPAAGAEAACRPLPLDLVGSEAVVAARPLCELRGADGYGAQILVGGHQLNPAHSRSRRPRGRAGASPLRAREAHGGSTRCMLASGAHQAPRGGLRG